MVRGVVLMTDDLETKTNLEMLKRSGFVFKEKAYGVAERYVRGKDWVIYVPDQDHVLVEYHASLAESIALSKRRTQKVYEKP